MQWDGQDEAGGSGIATFDVYYSTNGTEFLPWFIGTTNRASWFVGELGRNYFFYSVAHDSVGNSEVPPASSDSQTFVPTNAPVLVAVSNASLLPGQSFGVTNVVQGTPVGSWSFSLGPDAPAGASINPTNGQLRWVLSCSQASSTNTLTVWVTDTGRTNMMNTVSFTVTVGECVQPTLGQQVLLTGTAGRVPVNLISSVPLTNLQMTLVSPPGRLVSLSLQPIVQAICTNGIVTFSNGLYRLSLLTCPGQWLMGTQQVAWLNFAAAANQSSAFAKLAFTDLQGYEPDGSPVANFAPQSGRVVIVGEEPLLEMVRDTNRQPFMVLYGKSTTNYVIEWRTNLSLGSWKVVLTNLTVTTNLFLEIVPPPCSSRINFYRAS